MEYTRFDRRVTVPPEVFDIYYRANNKDLDATKAQIQQILDDYLNGRVTLLEDGQVMTVESSSKPKKKIPKGWLV